MSTRRTKHSLGFVNWPECNPDIKHYDEEVKDGFADSGEGGMECWMIVLPEVPTHEGRYSVRNVCITGFRIGVREWDAIATDWFVEYLGKLVHSTHGKVMRNVPPLDAAVCVGASGTSPVDMARGHYWQATFKDLTEEGQDLWQLMVKLYGIEPQLVMVLDT